MTKKVTKVLGYGRVSTNKQEISPQVQEQLCKQWFKSQLAMGRWRDGAIWAGMLVDDAVTSAIPLLKRPKGEMIPVVLDQGDVLVVAKLNRAFRSPSDSESTIVRLREAKIHFAILDLAIDPFSVNGELVVSVLSAVGKMQREQIRENTREALAHRREQGRPVGNAFIGFKNGRCGKRTWHEPDLIVRRIGAYCYRRLREGATLDMVYGELMAQPRKWGRDKPMSLHSILNLAVHCALGWPHLYRRDVIRKHGRRVYSVEFVRSHNQAPADAVQRTVRP